MRAALGLPSIEEMIAHHEAQRDLQYRRALYQDQLDQQLQELQIRANLAHLDDFSGLRSRILLSEHHRQRAEQEQALLRHALQQQHQQQQQQQQQSSGTSGGATAPSAPGAADGLGNSGVLHQALSEAQAAQSLYEEKLKLMQEHDQRRQEELLLLQVRQAMQEQQHGPQGLAASLALRDGLEGEGFKPRPPDFTIPSPSPPLGLAALTGLQAVADAAYVQPQRRLGTVLDLVQAASAEEKAFESADVLTSLKKVEWPESDDDEGEAKEDAKGDSGTKTETATTSVLPPEEPAESITTPSFQSLFPALPCEPLYEEPEDANDKNKEEGKEGETDEVAAGTTLENGAKTDGAAEMISNVLQYPYPVDTWYPTVNSRKRERRQQGESSGEDDFEEDKDLFRETNLRANPRKIRYRLASDKEPGVIEKIPHCRLHRTRTKYTTVSELLFCFQVCESYPNDLMVCCSKCGTWRHAECGGHYKPVSKRECLSEAFVAVCENCHAEEKYLKESERGRHFLERQRAEHLRRGLASSAVMRQLAFMKHGGSYKWPLGSVSATHVGGHIRSVQLRHDKSEKQWAELVSRLSRRYAAGSNKERARVRTKELERLLVCIEDAEGQTDRHNMLLFLERDCRRANPVGFEKERRNIFDPENVLPNYTENSQASLCVRPGCPMPHRFDSLFCSDACGVHVLERDLLNAFHEASDIHPSVLRFSY